MFEKLKKILFPYTLIVPLTSLKENNEHKGHKGGEAIHGTKRYIDSLILEMLNEHQAEFACKIDKTTYIIKPVNTTGYEEHIPEYLNEFLENKSLRYTPYSRNHTRRPGHRSYVAYSKKSNKK